MSKGLGRRTLREHVSPTPFFKNDISLPLENVAELEDQYMSSDPSRKTDYEPSASESDGQDDQGPSLMKRMTISG